GPSTVTVSRRYTSAMSTYSARACISPVRRSPLALDEPPSGYVEPVAHEAACGPETYGPPASHSSSTSALAVAAHPKFRNKRHAVSRSDVPMRILPKWVSLFSPEALNQSFVNSILRGRRRIADLSDGRMPAMDSARASGPRADVLTPGA